jgi:cytochrome c oxidase subunit 2
VGKYWSFLFFLVPVLGTVYFVGSAGDWDWPLIDQHWFPKDVSEYGYVIDNLFMIILWMTGIVFIATELALAWFMWRYDARTNRDGVKFIHGSHSLEVIWTVIPAATLLFIAIYQLNAWADTKVREPTNPGMQVEVTGRQFEWRLRYPGPDGSFDTPDDLYTVNVLHIPVGEDILVHLKSEDVLHDFFLPNLRVKQDAVPGMKIPVWFRATEQGVFDLVCAELCGWGHYKMKGRLKVETREAFEAWLAELKQKQHKSVMTTEEDEQ